jgi:hypothetical protein
VRTSISLTRLRRVRYIAAAISIGAASMLAFAGTASAATSPGVQLTPSPVQSAPLSPQCHTSTGTACTPAEAQSSNAAPSGATSNAEVSPAQESEFCYSFADTYFGPSYVTVTGESYYELCTGTIECYTTSDLQWWDASAGIWFTVASGPLAEGVCGPGTRSTITVDCSVSTSQTYRTLMIGVIFWEDGSYTTFDQTSPEISHGVLC